jgi:K(+)-stimulated pyrophosphate-energized sodium pump
LAKSCQTGHATNIIQGLAVGYESTVYTTVLLAAAILASVLIYRGTSPIFVAYGVAMCGIGMLTLTGNTISMDVFGPVADNANGIGEMAYDRDAMEHETAGSYARARRILADLDAVGNTTKAETKGIAIGSAVIAAVSLFASFIAVIAVGSEDRIDQMTVGQYAAAAAKLTLADPTLLIGLLLGGVVPFLFSSLLIRAVGRAAFLIVHEVCRQFRDPAVWQGHEIAGVRAGGEHLYGRGPAGTPRAGGAGDHVPPRRRVLPGAIRPRGVPGRHDPGRAVA